VEQQRYRVAVLDMQPIDPPLGGGRLRLLGLYHGLGPLLPTVYVGTYDWPGEKYRRHKLSPTLEEIDVPLSDEHFAVNAEWQQRVGGKTIIDTSFPLLAHLSPQFIHAAREAIAAAEIVVFSHPWVYPLVKMDLKRPSQLVVYDSQNVEGLLRTMLLDDGQFGTEVVKHAVTVEYELCHTADIVLACSHEDRELFHQLYNVPFNKIALAPNGTFTEHIQPVDVATRRIAKEKLGVGTHPLAIFLASFYQPNVEAAEFICTHLVPSFPDVSFAICGGVGEGLPQRLLNLPNVHVPGLLDEHGKRAYLAAADLAVNPMFSGSGTNIKMFDFMAAGLPVVTTPVGARGIFQGADPPFVLCEGADFAEGVRRVLQDDAYATALRHAARQVVERSYSWERISAKIGRLLYRLRSKLHEPVPFFSVIVPSYERHGQLDQLLECLARQTCRDFEVIIVDQSSGRWERNGRFAELDLLYIHTDIKGPGRARNTAAFYARGNVLAFTDDDCQPLPDWLEKARPYFHTPQVVGVEGLILSDKLDDPYFRPVTNTGFEGIGFMTANLFLRRETFMAIDGFDEAFEIPFREDTDMAWRALDHGEIPFGRDVRVFHPPQLRQIERESVVERTRFFQKDALLLKKHPERYRELFLREGHYLHTRGFRENFLAGAEKYGVEVDPFYVSLLAREHL
jgi:glycosyltransferase involved in cell wall biosynthesis